MRDHFILVADSSDGFVDSLKEALEATNYALLHAKDEREAIEYLELLKADIHLAIIALELPLLSGLDLIWRFVRQKQPKPMKIIATTSTAVFNGPLLENVVKELGVDAVVRKPIPPHEWRKIVEAVLSKQPGSSGRARPHTAA